MFFICLSIYIYMYIKKFGDLEVKVKAEHTTLDEIEVTKSSIEKDIKDSDDVVVNVHKTKQN
jgi:hypothetical protein